MAVKRQCGFILIHLSFLKGNLAVSLITIPLVTCLFQGGFGGATVAVMDIWEHWNAFLFFARLPSPGGSLFKTIKTHVFRF
jgi:hypothetical protein